MTCKEILNAVQLKICNDFKSQDVENGVFDAVFEVDRKKLFAHKNILAAVSKHFGVMFADRWTTKDEPIKLTEYSYDEYKEFMTFVYSGSCNFNDNNIFNLIDMAELYNVHHLKEYCDAHLAKEFFTCTVKKNAIDVFQHVELACQYSLDKLDKALKIYICTNFSELLRSDEFMKCKKSIVEKFVDYAGELGQTENEQCFLRVLEWGQKQAETKINDSNNENSDLQNGIKSELSGISMRLNFPKMSHLFFVEHVVKHSYLFSGEELSNISIGSINIIVTIVNEKLDSLVGKIPYNKEMFNFFMSMNNQLSDLSYYNCYDGWSRTQNIPFMSCSLKKNDSVPFYLAKRIGNICLLPTRRLLATDFLIAEMNGPDGFEISDFTKMFVTYNF